MRYKQQSESEEVGDGEDEEEAAIGSEAAQDEYVGAL